MTSDGPPLYSTKSYTSRVYTIIPPLIGMLAIISAVCGVILLCSCYIAVHLAMTTLISTTPLYWSIISGGIGTLLLCSSYAVVAHKRSGGAVMLGLIIVLVILYILWPCITQMISLGWPHAINIANYTHILLITRITILTIVCIMLPVHWHMIQRWHTDYYARSYYAWYHRPTVWRNNMVSHIRTCFGRQTLCLLLLPYICVGIAYILICYVPFIRHSITQDALLHFYHFNTVYEAVTNVILIITIWSIISMIVLTQFHTYLVVSDRASSTHTRVRTHLFHTKRPIPRILGICIIASCIATVWYLVTTLQHTIVPHTYFTSLTTQTSHHTQSTADNALGFINTRYLQHIPTTNTSSHQYLKPSHYDLLFTTQAHSTFPADVNTRYQQVTHSISQTTHSQTGLPHNLSGALSTHTDIFMEFARAIQTTSHTTIREPYNNITHDTPLPPHKLIDRYHISITSAALHCYHDDEKTCIHILRHLYKYVQKRYAAHILGDDIVTTIRLDRDLFNATQQIIETQSLSHTTRQHLIQILETHITYRSSVYKNIMIRTFNHNIPSTIVHDKISQGQSGAGASHTVDTITQYMHQFANERYYCAIEHNTPLGCRMLSRRLIWLVLPYMNATYIGPSGGQTQSQRTTHNTLSSQKLWKHLHQLDTVQTTILSGYTP